MTIEAQDLRCADVSGSDWSLITLRRVSLMDATLMNTNLARSTIAGCRFGGATLIGADFRGANIRDTNFRGADMTSAEFDERTVMVNVTCPDGTESEMNDGTCAGHLTP
jgi:uncharacterized protein YjbI with pentapeptide repeats